MQTRLVTAGLIALLVPAAALAQKVSYDYDKSANFASFKTYAHKDGTKVGQPLIDERNVAAIDAQMAEKGFTKSETSPDVFVVYHVAFDKQKDISTYSSGYGGGYGPYGWGWGGGMSTSTTQVRDIVVGTLVLDMADAKKGQLADLELRHRRRARCEDRIRCAKDTGLRNLPLQGFAQNQL